MGLDFTFKKYIELIQAIAKSGYSVFRVKDYLQIKEKPSKFIIIRHDVDVEPEYSLKLAKIEKNFGILSTYYFRTIKGVFQPDVINSIAQLGHEIGYHYEVLDRAKGDYNQAIRIFEKELGRFRQVYDVTTICPHGSPVAGHLSPYSFSGIFTITKTILQRRDVFTSWMNQDLWKKYDFKQFRVAGDAYLSIDFDKILYLSDTGRSWNPAYKLKDVANSSNNLIHQVKLNSTDDVIELIKQEKMKNIYILTHANHWKDNFGDWLKWLMLQYVRRTAKFGLEWYWKVIK